MFRYRGVISTVWLFKRLQFVVLELYNPINGVDKIIETPLSIRQSSNTTTNYIFQKLFQMFFLETCKRITKLNEHLFKTVYQF